MTPAWKGTFTILHPIRHIAFIGTYPPRQCGIATFTADLSTAIAAENPELSCVVIPINDHESGYAYSSRVSFEIKQDNLESYRAAADFINTHHVDVVSLQFEYGIFGGPAGRHILTFLRELHVPVVTTLHTILKTPDADQLQVLERVAGFSDRIVVMSHHGARLLTDIYHVHPDKIDFIGHGIPDIPLTDPLIDKARFGVADKTVILSFGLLSPNKGIEHVIAAMPEIVARFPDVVYLIVGATHPQIIINEDESYRLSLKWLVQEKNVSNAVVFYNRFVSLEELISFINAADIYITPYQSEAQTTSGTLAYALGAGKAVISTPYWYAQELLAEERGVLVPFQDPGAIAREVMGLLEHESERQAMCERAYRYGRDMIWSAVSAQYLASFERAIRDHTQAIVPILIAATPDKQTWELPQLKLDHLRRMTDETGLFQHAMFSVPNYQEGYTTDDNARGLILCTLLETMGMRNVAALTTRYLAFIWYAYNRESGRFRNFMNYQRQWLEDIGSDDSHGRTLWALGMIVGNTWNPSFQNTAFRLFELTLPGILGITQPRSWAFALLGLAQYRKRYVQDQTAAEIQENLALRLLALYSAHDQVDWHWFESQLTYCNAALSQALLVSGHCLNHPDMQAAGLKSLEWLSHIQCADNGYFRPIGSNGFYPKDQPRARFDQQPVEAHAMVSACLSAFQVTGDISWQKQARRAFDWFLGRNDLRISLYDPVTGGCRDGLHADRVNENQGAESTLSFLNALVELQITDNAILAEIERHRLTSLRSEGEPYAV